MNETEKASSETEAGEPDSSRLYLGHRGRKFTRLDAIQIPEDDRPSMVEMQSDEVTAICPVTLQPDMYRVTIRYRPADHILESKSLKLYLESFRTQGVFCEALPAIILRTIKLELHPRAIRVEVTQKRRGGIEITSVAAYPAQLEIL